MAGHSHWKQIKVQKGSADKKRAQVFSKLLNAVSIAARGETNPQFNPRLRAAIAKARENQVPQDNIERAIKKASEKGDNLEELVVEAYGPGGSALIIEAVTDSRNRTINELKLLFKDFEAKLAEPGSVRWAFDAQGGEEPAWIPKFKVELSESDRERLQALCDTLHDQDDVQNVFTNG